MATPVLSVVRRSLRLIGVLADGEQPTAQQMTDATETLAGLLGGWELQGVPVTTRPLVPTTEIAFPDTHMDAPVFALAALLAPEYGRTPRADVIARADDRERRLLAAYLTQPDVQIDPDYSQGRRWFVGQNNTTEQNVFIVGEGVLE